MDGIYVNLGFHINPSAERKAAIRRLWAASLTTIRVRHPDPRVDVTLILGYMTNTGEPAILFNMSNIRDTGNPDRALPNGVIHYGKIGWAWPGEKAAAAYVAALWSLYMIHEGLELTTYRRPGWPTRLRDTEVQVVDAHDANGAHQQFLSQKTSDLPATMDWILGIGNGQKLIDECAEQARQELANEMNPWIPGT